MREETKKVIAVAQKAGKKVMGIYGREFKVSEKKDKSPVTEADLVSQKVILEELKGFGYDILSEEKENTDFGKEKRWIVDPLDGTQDFLAKTGEFAIMIGLAEKEEPAIGVIYLPAKDKLYWAEKGKGSFLNNSRIAVSEVGDLKDSRIVTSRFHLDKDTRYFLDETGVLAVKAGSIGFKAGLIAEGKAEGYLTFSDKTCQWDTCAPQIILEEAGGKMTNLAGENLEYKKEIKNLKGIIASNKLIHQQIYDRATRRKIN